MILNQEDRTVLNPSSLIYVSVLSWAGCRRGAPSATMQATGHLLSRSLPLNRPLSQLQLHRTALMDLQIEVPPLFAPEQFSQLQRAGTFLQRQQQTPGYRPLPTATASTSAPLSASIAIIKAKGPQFESASLRYHEAVQASVDVEASFLSAIRNGLQELIDQDDEDEDDDDEDMEPSVYYQGSANVYYSPDMHQTAAMIPAKHDLLFPALHSPTEVSGISSLSFAMPPSEDDLIFPMDI